MKTIRITSKSTGWGLLIENGKFAWVEDGDQAAQHATERLLIFKGEWILDEDMGTKWYEIIFDMSKSKAEKEFEIKKRILKTPGIDSITTFSWTQTGHTVSIEGIVKTDWGEVDIGQEIITL